MASWIQGSKLIVYLLYGHFCHTLCVTQVQVLNWFYFICYPNLQQQQLCECFVRLIIVLAAWDCPGRVFPSKRCAEIINTALPTKQPGGFCSVPENGAILELAVNHGPHTLTHMLSRICTIHTTSYTHLHVLMYICTWCWYSFPPQLGKNIPASHQPSQWCNTGKETTEDTIQFYLGRSYCRLLTRDKCKNRT